VAVDGTKVEADAGRGSVHREATIAGRLAKIDEQIEALEREWEANKVREAGLFGKEVPWVPSGSEAVRIEWSMICTAVNMGILLRHWPEVSGVL
jgi:hypothetical protein